MPACAAISKESAYVAISNVEFKKVSTYKPMFLIIMIFLVFMSACLFTPQSPKYEAHQSPFLLRTGTDGGHIIETSLCSMDSNIKVLA